MNTFFDMLVNFIDSHNCFKILYTSDDKVTFNINSGSDGTTFRLSRIRTEAGSPDTIYLEHIDSASDLIGRLELAEESECTCRIVNEVHATHEPTPMHEFVLLYNKFKGISNISHVDMLKVVNLNRLTYIRQWIIDATDYIVADNSEESITLNDLLALDKSLVLGIGDHGQLVFKRKKSQTIETICDVVYVSFTDLKIANTIVTDSNDITVIMTLLHKYSTWAKLVKTYGRQYLGAYPSPLVGSIYERMTNAGLHGRLEKSIYGSTNTSNPMIEYVPSRAGEGIRFFAVDNSLTVDIGLITVSDNTLIFNLNEENIQCYYSDIMLSDLHVGTLIEEVSKVWKELNDKVASDSTTPLYAIKFKESTAAVADTPVTFTDETVNTLIVLKERLIAQQQLIEHRLALIEQLLETY